MLEEQIGITVEEPRRRDGVSIAVAVSFAIHTLILIYVVRTYKPIGTERVATPIVHYVELMRQNPQERTFTEAPGAKLKTPAPADAPFSDANRKASMPHPTGENPTLRPGEGSHFYTPPTGSPRPRSGSQSAVAGAQPQQQSSQPTTPQMTQSQANALAFRQPTGQSSDSGVNWHSAIREVGKVASLGQQEEILGTPGGGGEKGFAENGPISFESQWYDWGEYAASMVRRIRVNWLSIMPDLIKNFIKGHLTVRFTIHRDGRISDIVILEGSGVPPYDFAAKKALEMSSPLNPLPKDFPNDSERVTAMFFYNEEPPNR